MNKDMRTADGWNVLGAVMALFLAIFVGIHVLELLYLLVMLAPKRWAWTGGGILYVIVMVWALLHEAKDSGEPDNWAG